MRIWGQWWGRMRVQAQEAARARAMPCRHPLEEKLLDLGQWAAGAGASRAIFWSASQTGSAIAP